MRVELRPLALLLALVFGPSLPAASVQPVWMSFPDYDGAAQGGFPCQLADDGKTIASALDGGRIVFRSSPDFLISRIVSATKSPVRALAISPDGRFAAAAGEGGEISIVERATGDVELIRPAVIRRPTWPSGPWPACLKYSASGDRLLALYNNGGLWVYEPGTRKTIISRFTDLTQIFGADTTPNLNLIAASDGSRKICVFDTESGTLLRTVQAGGDTTVRPRFNPSGHLLGVIQSGAFQEFDLETGKLVHSIRFSGTDGAYTADGEEFLSTSSIPALYKLSTGEFQALTYRLPLLAAVNTRQNLLFLAYDGYAAGQTGEISQELMSLKDLRTIASARGEGQLRSIAYSPDGKLVVQAAVRTSPVVRKVTGELVGILPGGTISNNAHPRLAFSNTGEMLAISHGRALYLYRMADRSLIYQQTLGSDLIGALGFSRDGDQLLFLKNGCLKALDIRSNFQERFLFPGTYEDLQVSKSGRIVLSDGLHTYLSDSENGSLSQLPIFALSKSIALDQGGGRLYIWSNSRIQIYALPDCRLVGDIRIPDLNSSLQVVPLVVPGACLINARSSNGWRTTLYRYRNETLETLQRLTIAPFGVEFLTASSDDQSFAFVNIGQASGVRRIVD